MSQTTLRAFGRCSREHAGDAGRPNIGDGVTGCVVGCTPVGRWCTDELVSTDRSTSSAAATQCGGQGFVLAGTSKSTSCAPVFICLLADVFDNRRYI
jgi:type II secretory pathway pseudopilin PulG